MTLRCSSSAPGINGARWARRRRLRRPSRRGERLVYYIYARGGNGTLGAVTAKPTLTSVDFYPAEHSRGDIPGGPDLTIDASLVSPAKAASCGAHPT